MFIFGLCVPLAVIIVSYVGIVSAVSSQVNSKIGKRTECYNQEVLSHLFMFTVSINANQADNPIVPIDVGT